MFKVFVLTFKSPGMSYWTYCRAWAGSALAIGHPFSGLSRVLRLRVRLHVASPRYSLSKLLTVTSGRHLLQPLIRRTSYRCPKSFLCSPLIDYGRPALATMIANKLTKSDSHNFVFGSRGVGYSWFFVWRNQGHNHGFPSARLQH